VFNREKKTRTCPEGHPQEDTWEQCPFCTADGLPGGRAESHPELADETEPAPPEPGKGAVVVPKKKPKVERALTGWVVAVSGEQEGEDFRILAGRNVLGKAATVDIVLKDSWVSERHAVLESQNGTYRLSDLESRHGTFVNGERIAEPHAVSDGDRIRLGRTELKFRSFT
jgi:hypothetical protein